jgi:hypothetical protein
MSQELNSAVAVIGIDIGKDSFHIVGHGHRGAIVLRQKWSRSRAETRLANLPPCLIGMEACVRAHHLSRKLQMLGHDARLMHTIMKKFASALLRRWPRTGSTSTIMIRWQHMPKSCFAVVFYKSNDLLQKRREKVSRTILTSKLIRGIGSANARGRDGGMGER